MCNVNWVQINVKMLCFGLALAGCHIGSEKKHHSICRSVRSSKRAERRSQTRNVKCQSMLKIIFKLFAKHFLLDEIIICHFLHLFAVFQIFFLILFGMICAIVLAVLGIMYYQKRKESSRKLWWCRCIIQYYRSISMLNILYKPDDWFNVKKQKWNCCNH